MSAIRHQFDVNLAGPMNVTRAALPGLRATEGSRLVNVSSVGGLSPLPGLAGYCGSKWALEGWTEALAHELRPLGVRVALVEPASVETGCGRRARSTVTPTARTAASYGRSRSATTTPGIVRSTR